ncbi:hypothetical protein [Flindersiella endophytica]
MTEEAPRDLRQELDELHTDGISAYGYSVAWGELVRRGYNVWVVHTEGDGYGWYRLRVKNGPRKVSIGVATRRKPSEGKTPRNWQPDAPLWQDSELVIGVDFSKSDAEPTFQVIRRGEKIKDPSARDAFHKINELIGNTQII